MTYLIHGATGAQGAPVHAALARSGASVVAAVRDPAAFDGDAVAVDFSSVGSLAAAYSGKEGVFIHLPIGSPDQQLAHAQAAVAAVDRARPQRVVVSTSGYSTEGDGAVAALIEGLKGTGVSFATVAPRLFLENLLLPFVVASVRDQGVLLYPIRRDYAVSWSSHLDVADVIAGLLVRPDVTGTVGVGALPGLVGDDLAAAFARYFDRDVTFEAQDPDAFGTLLAPLIGQDGTDAVVASYHWRATQADETIESDSSAQRRLGVRPRSVEQWLRDLGV
ncbi:MULTISPECIES: SDR family oxidoreductase [unclassified Microbacterium]|uniref:SDR family oxidoreductase n=1 Tax=unclassified Microbacterium TaxID=2609290 RepID=UPI00177EBA9E|nr:MULTISPECIES: NAD(P)H-binding protein [unclassified Microbacterium]MBD8207816.1 NAD(P)H-binding protein [Microbacterium sp. CFBP 8801]MBD8478042.1 NAD(P)H-binding protein [Microbacterium sp. CFBP 8794]MBD8508697.1 NAD(P)H-binding protein [Microbacterium sp. CFBP 8790]